MEFCDYGKNAFEKAMDTLHLHAYSLAERGLLYFVIVPSNDLGTHC
jgi:hypothetical protein